MLTALQRTYADRPVRFLLFPCNQFDHQEPGSNAVVKAFAEKFVTLGPGSNVIMLAKGNLNNVSCAAQGDDACAPTSVECCPANDGIYDYLLSATSPGEIQWNFDKIVVDGSGRPFQGESILHGEALGAVLGAAIAQAAEPVEVLVESEGFSEGRWSVQALAQLLAMASLVLGMTVAQVKRRQRSQQTTPLLRTQYVMLP